MLLRSVVARSFRLPPPPSGTAWVTAYRAALSSGNQIATYSGTPSAYGHAFTDILTGKRYFELETSTAVANVEVGFSPVDDVSSDPGDWGDFGFVNPSSRSVKVVLGSYWSIGIYQDNNYLDTLGEANHTDDPLYRVGLAVDVPNRLAWIIEVWSTGNGSWYDGGDPGAGTGGLAINGSEDIRLAASMDATGKYARIVAPADHYGSAPSGFTAS